MINSDDGFDLSTPDSVGYVPDLSLIGKAFRHKKGHVYTIRGFAWCGIDDRWQFLHNRTGSPVMCCRTPENFFEPGRYEGPL